MSWIALTLASALFLGCYDVAKKHAVRENAVPAVLFCNVSTAAAMYAPMVLLHAILPARFHVLELQSLSPLGHLMLFLKSAIVGASWACAFFALKNLPISIATPIRATSPLWTITIAVLLLGESPNPWQWAGMAIILTAFGMLALAGKKEGITFTRNRWIGLMCAATLLGACSALYDKILIQRFAWNPVTVQAWFSIYLVPVLFPLASYWWLRERKTNPFEFRWSIPLIAVCLLVADYLYFSAIQTPDAMIALISPARRTSAIIPFAFGILMLSEQNWRAKLACLCLMFLGVFLLSH